jgi:hypothetical protein
MSELYEQTVHVFRKINPERKYFEFTFTDLKCYTETEPYLTVNEIVRIHGEFWLYTGAREQLFFKKKKPVIRFIRGRTIVKEVSLKTN